MSTIDLETTIGELVAERPDRARLFEKLQLDYCCGGDRTLAEASGERGLDPGTVRTMLEALDDRSGAAGSEESTDWRSVSVAELCEHIVSVHHDGLRRDLPRISELLAKVVRAHGAGHPELGELAERFAGVRAELEHHLATEEEVLFPAARALEAGERTGDPVAEELLARHEREHAGAGEGLEAMRELGRGYEPDAALCRTHGALLDALRSFEADLHRHIHEENNILFPRVRAMGAASAGGAGHAELEADGSAEERPAGS